MESSSDLEPLSRLLSLLQEKNRSFPADRQPPPESLQSLIFANTLLRRAGLQQGRGLQLPPQLVVIGPTQSGKSTLVNLLLGQVVAEASPLAGYTRYAHGFSSVAVTDETIAGLAYQLPGWERVEQVPREGTRGDLYTLQSLPSGAGPEIGQCIVWDTPDFDSVSSREYRNSVPEICALADLILLVVSREKYADQSVWQMLRLLAPAGIPLLICLNKMDQQAESALRASLQQRLEAESIPCAGIFSLPYRQGLNDGLLDGQAAAALRRESSRLLEARVRPRLPPLLQRHWQDWTGPLRRELAAADLWQNELSRGREEVLALYQRDYLQNPHYADSLKRAMARLLELLEIPGIAVALARTRELVTWPARRLQRLFRERSKGQQESDLGDESRILLDTIDHLLIRLQRMAGEQALADRDGAGGWWQALAAALNARREGLRRAAAAAVADYQAGFEVEIQQAGQRMFEHLERHPATLNSLRAARVTTDAGALVLAIKSGGVGLNDLIVAPAMLSFTTLLAEGAVGRYVQQVENELKARQLQQVEGKVLAQVERLLLALPAQSACDNCYGISREQLEQAEAVLGKLIDE